MMTISGQKIRTPDSLEMNKRGSIDAHPCKENVTEKLQMVCNTIMICRVTSRRRLIATTKESRTIVIDWMTNLDTKMTFMGISLTFAPNKALMHNWQKWTRWSCKLKRTIKLTKTITNLLLNCKLTLAIGGALPNEAKKKIESLRLPLKEERWNA